MRYNGTLYYYVLNLQGDVIEIVEPDGTVMASYTYDAWGNILSSTGSLAAINPIRYRGYYYDSETGLYYLGSRYYDPEVKRFINADSASLITSNTYALTDKNLFAYCDNNPTNRKDNGGDCWGIVGAAVLGGVCGMFNAAASGQNLAAGFIVGAATSAASSYLHIGSAVVDACISGIGKKANNSTGTIEWKSVASAAIIGGVSSLIGARTASNLAKAIGTSKVAQGVVNTVTSAFITTATISVNAIYTGYMKTKESRGNKGRQQQNNRVTVVCNRYRRQYN